MERSSVLSFQHLLSPRGPGQGGVVVCGVDVSLLAEWQRVERRVREYRTKRDGDWTTQLVAPTSSHCTSTQPDECDSSRVAVAHVTLFSLSRSLLCSSPQQSLSSDASSLLRVSLPRLSQLLHSLVREPAQTLIPHLRNRLGYNIDDYVQQIRNIATQIVEQQQRYDRLLKQRQ